MNKHPLLMTSGGRHDVDCQLGSCAWIDEKKRKCAGPLIGASVKTDKSDKLDKSILK